MAIGVAVGLAKKVGQAVIPKHTVVGKAIGSTYGGSGIDFKTLAPPGSKAQKLLGQIENSAQIAGNIFNPVPSVNSLAQNTKGSVNSLLTTNSAQSKITASYQNDVNAKDAQASVSTVSIPAGALDGKLIPFGANGSTKTSPIIYVTLGFLALKLLKII